MAVETNESGLINLVYPNIENSTENIADRAILATTNQICDDFN
jgi:hypothetical protein